MKHWFTVLALSLPLLASAASGEVEEILNFTAYSDTLASSGQPSNNQLVALKNEGYQRVIYIALTTSEGALAGEDKIVKDLGMSYAHIPVTWGAPRASDFHAFAALMQADKESKTLLHCQANYRATAFAFLYRVIYEGVSVATAKTDMNAIWHPGDVWRKFIFELLEANGISPHCDGCDWNVPED